MLGQPACFGLGAHAAQLFGLGNECGHGFERLVGVLAAARGDVACRLLQRLAHRLVLCKCFCTHTLPFTLQACGHGVERLCPGRKPLLFGQGLVCLRLGQVAADGGQQCTGAFCKGVGERCQCAVQALGLRVAGAGVVLQGRCPGVGHGAGRGAKLRRQPLYLRKHLHLNHFAQARVHPLGLCGHFGHGGFDYGLQALARNFGAGGEAVFE